MVRIVPELPGDDPDEATARWRDDVATRINALTDHLTDHLTDRLELAFDFSPASLAALEIEVARRDADPDDLDDPLTAGAIAYLGETLMRAGGGRWLWHTEPTVAFDPGLELPDLTPRTVLTMPSVLPVYQGVAAAAAARRAAEPGWEPAKLATLGVDPYEPAVPGTDVDAWRAVRRAAFERWAAGDSGWDFTPGSLDRLEDAVRADPEADPEFAGLAAWYFGEVLVRAKGGTWQASTGEPGESPFAGRQWVQSPRDAIAIPALLVELLRDPAEEPGLLRSVYEGFR